MLTGIVCLRDPKDVCISYCKLTQSLEMLTGIVCLRDPKDVCISYYKFTQSLEMLTGTHLQCENRGYKFSLHVVELGRSTQNMS